MNVYEVFVVSGNSVTHFVLEASDIGAAIGLAVQHQHYLPHEAMLNVLARRVAANTTLEHYTAAVEQREA